MHGEALGVTRHITVQSLDVTCAFYEQVLGFQRIDVPGRPTASQVGQQRINVHEVGRTFDPKAAQPTPGAADSCLITDRSINDLAHYLESFGVTIELGPIARVGAQGEMTSSVLSGP